ncbi:hypothetical protein [Paenibacillus nasutitermitis]|uniref:Uncharacterized protein n=1 Tax=Paenibacillus nasutitermitis TaxID=1652958 RepID=A0A917DRS6_9BACL|nr:hypothetical protein [Paenibacillus nasutitermitis]GGD64826.1 hypothetical protein GCM10010911_23270 [Paenibacillus nasutitermitis]
MKANVTFKWLPFLLLAFCFLIPAVASAAPPQDGSVSQRPVQAFDIGAGKVVKSVPNNKEFQAYAINWLGSVTGLAPQAKPEDKCGYVFRIPLKEPAMVKAGTASVRTSDVFLFYCPDKPQVLLIFDENRKPFLLTFKADTKPFLKQMGL